MSSLSAESLWQSGTLESLSLTQEIVGLSTAIPFF